jgi:hypothetical protein
VSPDLYMLFTWLLMCCDHLDRVRQFALLSFVVLARVMRKVKKLQLPGMKEIKIETLMKSLDSTPFHKDKEVPELFTSASAIVQAMLSRKQRVLVPCYLCGVSCSGQRVTLGCGETVCFDCLTVSVDLGSTCAVCKTPSSIDAGTWGDPVQAHCHVRFDTVLTQFIPEMALMGEEEVYLYVCTSVRLYVCTSVRLCACVSSQHAYTVCGSNFALLCECYDVLSRLASDLCNSCL